MVIATRNNHQKTIKNQAKMSQKSPQVVKHVVKCEKRACSTLEAGKNKPVLYTAKIRDFARKCEKTKKKRSSPSNWTHLRFLVRVFITKLLKYFALRRSKHILIVPCL